MRIGEDISKVIGPSGQAVANPGTLLDSVRRVVSGLRVIEGMNMAVETGMRVGSILSETLGQAAEMVARANSPLVPALAKSASGTRFRTIETLPPSAPLSPSRKIPSGPRS